MNVISTADHLVGKITCPSQEVALALADALVEAQAAACVNIVPGLLSVYRWQGEICHDQEVLLLVKTTRQRIHEVKAVVEKIHPYDEPELLFSAVEMGSESYLDWVTKSVTVK